jgi:DnaJ-class molecular chaperone
MARDVAVCPRCNGDKKIYNSRSGRSEDCPTCEGSGVVWHVAEEAVVRPLGDDVTDLTYRRE